MYLGGVGARAFVTTLFAKTSVGIGEEDWLISRRARILSMNPA
jgi:hypothetical protein